MRKLYIALIFICFLLTPDLCISEELFNKKGFKKDSSEETYDITKSTEYLLGPGDILYIDFIGLDIFSKKYEINPDGFIDLPEIEPVYAYKKTLNELKIKLLNRYKEYIIKPDIKLYIAKYRPVNVIINGEVKQPGLYTLNYVQPEIKNEEAPDIVGGYKIPKVFDAIALTRGITNNADLSNIKIIRDDSLLNGGGKISTNLNFLSLLIDGDQEVNIRLMDGDMIIIPVSKKPIKDQILSLNKSNLTPNKISIYVSGNIANPGEYLVQQGTSLIQAIYKAGGENYFTGTVNHFRFYENGKREKTKISLDFNSKNNPKNNPTLLDGDIIHLKQSVIGKTSKAIGKITQPLVQTQFLFNLFD